MLPPYLMISNYQGASFKSICTNMQKLDTIGLFVFNIGRK